MSQSETLKLNKIVLILVELNAANIKWYILDFVICLEMCFEPKNSSKLQYPYIELGTNHTITLERKKVDERWKNIFSSL